jgi:hypothetical protein
MEKKKKKEKEGKRRRKVMRSGGDYLSVLNFTKTGVEYTKPITKLMRSVISNVSISDAAIKSIFNDLEAQTTQVLALFPLCCRRTQTSVIYFL